jgi:hypothetical protein
MKESNEDFMETFHDDSKFGGKSISSPIKTIEVFLSLSNQFFNIIFILG